MSLLEIDRCTMQFGGLRAVQEVSLNIDAGELIGVIGPNGAGKTTLFNLMTGVYHPTHGTLTFDGKRIDQLAPFQICRLGIARTFQNIRLFGNLTVLENVLAGFQPWLKSGIPATIFRTPAFQAERDRVYSEAYTLLELFDLKEKAGQPSTTLSYGDQRRLELARALASRPKLLLLDEPAAGMNPTETKTLAKLIKKIHADYSLTILLIEHDMGFVMNLCRRIAVMDEGKKIAEGPPAQIQNDPAVIEAYLGEPEKA